MKRIFLLVIALLVLAGCAQPPEDVESAQTVTTEAAETPTTFDTDGVPVDSEKSSFMFTGYGPGKEHEGTFTVGSGTLHFEEDVVVGAEGLIDVTSVDTGIGGLDSHLLKDDFFNAELYPTITMESSSMNETHIVGDLTFLGVTKTIVFPYTVIENGISTDFLLDTEQFGMSYVGVNSDVRIVFTLVV